MAGSGLKSELMVRVVSGARQADCLVKATGNLKVSETIESLRRAWGDSIPEGASLSLDGRTLDRNAQLLASGVLHGSVLTVVTGAANTQETVSRAKGCIVEVTRGPAAGVNWFLDEGTWSIGKDNNCSLVVYDPRMARHHADLIVSAQGELFLKSTGQQDTWLNGEAVKTGVLKLDDGATVGLGGNTSITVTYTAPVDVGQQDRYGQLLFNRNPHKPIVIKDRDLGEIPDEPEEGKPPRIRISSAVMPIMTGVMMALVLKNPIFLIFVAAAPFMVFGNFFEDKRNRRKDYQAAVEDYEEQLDEKDEEIDKALKDMRGLMERRAPEAADAGRRALSRQPNLWERVLEKEDFGLLRAGLSNIDTKISIRGSRKSGTGASYRKRGQAMVAKASSLPGAPVEVSLLDDRLIGLYGEEIRVNEALDALMVQITCLHSPSELVVGVCLGDDDKAQEHYKWLPHVRSASSPIAGDHLAKGRDACRTLVREIAQIAENRASDRNADKWPLIVLVLSDKAGVDSSDVNRLLEAADKGNVAVLWYGAVKAKMPRQCRLVLDVGNTESGDWGKLLRADAAGVDYNRVAYEYVDRAYAEAVFMALSAMRDPSSTGGSESIPKTATLEEVLGGLDTSFVENNWAMSVPGELKAPVGIGENGPLWVDFVEQGPHGLIGGTSGAGKSELLGCMVASLSWRYSPKELNFLFIDYKGGAAFNEVLDLPHCVGMVTDLNEAQSHRALVSLKAELKRREELLEGRARDIVELGHKFPEITPPRLVLVVDEFATLVKEIPDFVQGIIDVAQRGRSLGIHMMLATQRPSGSVNDNILANTNLRIALRMLDSGDSSRIIGVDAAAKIPVPLKGRALVRSGPTELEYFQSGWAGAPWRSGGSIVERTCEIVPFEFGKKRREVEASTGENTGITQLQKAVEMMKIVNGSLGIPEPKKPWLEPIGTNVNLSGVLAQQRSVGRLENGQVLFGKIDLPEKQAQIPAVCDLREDGNLIVTGIGGSGKTTLLRTMAASIAVNNSVEEAKILVFDFAGGGLRHLSSLPHVCEVVDGDDLDRVTRNLLWLQKELETRRNLLAAKKAGKLEELDKPPARIYVLMDNYGEFSRVFERLTYGDWTQSLTKLAVEGRQAGIHLIVANDRRGGIPTGLFSACGSKLVMQAANVDEYLNMGISSKTAKTADLEPGDAFFNGENYTKIAVVGNDASGASQIKGLDSLSERMKTRESSKATGALSLPKPLKLANLKQVTWPKVALGIKDSDFETQTADLKKGHLLVLGGAGSGRTTALRNIALGLSKNKTKEQRLWVAGDRGEYQGVSCDCWGEENAVNWAAEIYGSGDKNTISDIIVIDDADWLASGGKGGELDEALQKPGVRLIAGLTPGLVSKIYGGALAEAKSSRQYLFVAPDLQTDSQVAQTTLKVRTGVQVDVGVGIYMTGSRYNCIHLPS